MSNEIDRPAVRGDVLDSVTIEIRQERPDGPWRLYTYGESVTHDQMPLSRGKGANKRIFGGTHDQAQYDAELLCAEGGFMLRRSSGLLLP